MKNSRIHRPRWLVSFALTGMVWGCTTDEASKPAARQPNDIAAQAEDGDDANGPSTDGSSGDYDLSGDGSAALPPLTPTSYDEGAVEPLPDEQATVEVSPFVAAAEDPFSTFGADVDSASYDHFRNSLVTYGALPTPSSVRVEDFVNYFRYDYATPAFDAVEPFAIDLAAAAHPLGRSTSLLRVGIQAKAPPPEEKKPANIVFLVDVSGSMADPLKLPLVKVVLGEALDELAPDDTVSIVSYAGDTRVRLEPTRVSERSAISSAIDGLESGGGTNGASGIELAYSQAAEGFIEGGINHVILCTDGDFNLGITSNEALVTLIRDKRETGITLTALGFGYGNLNDDMMEAVSNAGNGMYSVVFSEDQAIEYAHERLLSTLVHVAKDMKIQVEFNPAHVSAYRLIGYENRAIADDQFRDDLVDGGEVGAGHRVTALYEVVLAGAEIPAPEGAPAVSSGESTSTTPEIAEGELVRVKVRYKAPTATDSDPAAEVVRALTPDQLSVELPLSPDVAWAAAVAGFAERLRGSPYASAAELATIEQIVEQQKERDSDRAEFADLLTRAQELLVGAEN